MTMAIVTVAIVPPARDTEHAIYASNHSADTRA